MRRRLLLILIGVAVILPLGALPAEATTYTPAQIASIVFHSSNPHARYNQLYPENKVKFNSYVEVYKSRSVSRPRKAIKRPVSPASLPGLIYVAPPTQKLRSSTSAVNAAAPAVTGCWSYLVETWGQNLLGNDVTHQYVYTNVCFTNNNVDLVWANGQGSTTSWVGWRIVKKPVAKARAVTTGTGQSRFARGIGWSQAYFVAGIGGWDIQHYSPCIRGRQGTLGTNGIDYLAHDQNCDIQAGL